MADREGFEPSLPLTVNTLSKRARSTTLPSVLIHCGGRSKKNFYELGNLFWHFFLLLRWHAFGTSLRDILSCV